MTVRKMFSEESLNKILIATYDKNLDDIEFAKFHKEHITSILGNFNYDKCTISLIITDGRGGTLDFGTILYGIEDPVQDVMDNYAKFAQEDRLSEIVYHNPGRAFLHSDVYEGKFENHSIFKNHCSKYGIHKVCSVGYSMIPVDEVFVAFDYMVGEGNGVWPGIDPIELEYASFPFALAWAARRMRVGQIQLERHFKALAGMTLKKLEKLRRFINSSAIEELSEQAESLNLKLSGYDSALYEIRDMIVSRFPGDFKDVEEGKSLKLDVIRPYFMLVSMLKNQTSPIFVPENIKLTPSYHQRMSGE